MKGAPSHPLYPAKDYRPQLLLLMGKKLNSDHPLEGGATFRLWWFQKQNQRFQRRFNFSSEVKLKTGNP